MRLPASAVRELGVDGHPGQHLGKDRASYRASAVVLRIPSAPRHNSSRFPVHSRSLVPHLLPSTATPVRLQTIDNLEITLPFTWGCHRHRNFLRHSQVMGPLLRYLLDHDVHVRMSELPDSLA